MTSRGQCPRGGGACISGHAMYVYYCIGGGTDNILGGGALCMR